MSPRSDRPPKEHGAAGFSAAYWEANYSDPESMEGIANAREHVAYLKSFFELEDVEVESIVDLGCGLGFLFQEVLYRFSPDRALGMDPSAYAIDQTQLRQLDPYNRIDVQLACQDILSWTRSPVEEPWDTFDLGICTSVWQYLTDDELEQVLPVLAERCTHLYLTVPTDKELKRQRNEVDFDDRYAFRRSRSRYLSLIKPHFTVIGNRMLQSKRWFDAESSPFTDLLFRF